MRVVLIVAQSLDGFITRHDAPGAGWASAADQARFRRSLTQFGCGGHGPPDLRHRAGEHSAAADDRPLPRIMTRDLQTRRRITPEGRLEFTDQNPGPTRRLTAQGCTACALLGGSHRA